LAAGRQLYTGIRLYAMDEGSSLPYFATPGVPTPPTTLNGNDVSGAAGGYFTRQSALWMSLVRPYVNSSPIVDGNAVFHPVLDNNQVIWSQMFLTATAFASPDYFDPSHEVADDMLRGMRFSQIRHPPRKGLLLDIGSGFYKSTQSRFRPILVTFCDGSVAARKFEEASLPVDRPKATDLPIMATFRGMEGVDF
jgi:hypothetical protein